MTVQSRYGWALRIRSKYTGAEIVLGARYSTRELADKAAAEIVCPRCNYVDVITDYETREHTA